MSKPPSVLGSFGDRIRSSSLATMSRCPGLFVDQRTNDEPGAAADTGSAVGRGAQLWHEGATLGDAVAQVEREASSKFPLAKLEEATETIRRYTQDERNHPKAAFHCELEIDLVLPCWPGDPTNEPIHIRGHLDQIRRGNDGRLYVWDLKNGKPTGFDMVHGYAWQLASYALGATQKLGQVVLPGGIVRTQGYSVKGDPSVANVFYETPWSHEQCRAMLENVAFHVMLIRRGDVLRNPGAHCGWCSLSPATCSL